MSLLTRLLPSLPRRLLLHASPRQVFSYIGIAIGSGCITGPAIGGYLADPSLLSLVPADTAIGAVIRAYPYLAPCAAGALLSILIFAMAVVNLKESRQPAIPLFRSFSKTSVGPTTPLVSPLLANPQPGASAVLPMRSDLMPGRTYSAGWGSPGPADGGLTRASYSVGGGAGGGGAGGGGLVRRESSSALLEAMAGMAGRSSLVVDDEQHGSSITSSPMAPAPHSGSGSSHASHESAPKPVNAVTLAMKHSLSPKAQRLELFSRGSRTPSLHASPAASTMKVEALHEEEGLSEAARQSVFWLIQLSCFLFTLTNVGLTEVLPVWLSTPTDSTGDHTAAGGLGLSPYVIGNLQSTTGVGNIVLALFVTFRIIAAIGPVRTFAISLAINAAAAFGPPVIQLLPDGILEPIQLGLMCVSYSLVAASRNMMFSTAIMLSKEAASGAPGVAIGINQSACSLGGACGPLLTGFAYTQSLRVLFACMPFFVGVGILGATPAVLMATRAPPWPWKNHELLQPGR